MSSEALHGHKLQARPRGVAARPAPPEPRLFVHPVPGEAPVAALPAAEALVRHLGEGLARYRAMVCLASEAPDAPPPDRMLITVEPAVDGDLHLGLFLPGSDRLRLDLIDLGIYRLLENGLPVAGRQVRLVPLPCFARLTPVAGFLQKDVIYRIAPEVGPDPDEPAMGG